MIIKLKRDDVEAGALPAVSKELRARLDKQQPGREPISILFPAGSEMSSAEYLNFQRDTQEVCKELGYKIGDYCCMKNGENPSEIIITLS